jgi:hypothetical protein
LLDGDPSQGYAINDESVALAGSGIACRTRAFPWTRSSGGQDLNALFPSGNDYVLFEPVGTNDRGTIPALGSEDDGHGNAHGYHKFPNRVFLSIP